MKSILLILFFYFFAIQPAFSIGNFACSMEFDSDTGKCFNINGISDSNEVVVTGELAEYIFNSAIKNNISPAQLISIDNAKEKVEYRGWVCVKHQSRSAEDFIVQNLRALHSSLNGKISCYKDLF